jgi:transposase-like protein
MRPALRALPTAQVQISLPVQGVLRDVRHAFLGLCIDAGQKALAALMESDRVALCGASGVPDAQRRAVRGGSTASQVVLGGQRIAVRRPRARSLTQCELSLPSFEWAAHSDPLDAATMAAMAAGVSTRRYASTQEPVAAAHHPSAASKSAVSRRFVQISQEQLAQRRGAPARGTALQRQARLEGCLVGLGCRSGARKQFSRLAASLQSKHPGAAASLREGLEESLTVQTLGITGALQRTLRTTNPIENLNGSVAHYCRNVKRWGDGQMVLRWVASALSDASTRMRKLRGCSQMRSLIKALDARRTTAEESATLKAAWHVDPGAVTSHGSTASGTLPRLMDS